MTWKQWVGSEYNKGYEDYKFGTGNITCEGEECGIFTLVNGCSVFLSKNDKQVFR